MHQRDKNKLAEAIYSPELFTYWQRIARAAKQCEASDVAQQAFMQVLLEWGEWFDIHNPDHLDKLKHQMFKYFMKAADRVLKKGQSFNQLSTNDAEERLSPALLGIKAADNTEPLQQMIDEEDQRVLEEKQAKQIEENSFSAVLAYTQLFEDLKTKMLKHTYLNIAAQMKMSYSWLHQCLCRAKKLQKVQPSLFDGVESVPLIQHLGSWRKFKITRSSLKFAPTVLANQLTLFQ